MYNRHSWDTTYMEMCNVLAKRSTCVRIQTSSVIVKNNIIVSVGYNGVATGQQHCCDMWKEYYDLNINGNNYEHFLKTDWFYQKHHDWSDNNEMHGEMNAILFAGKNGIPLNNATIYTIYSPCINCAKAILTSGICRVVYRHVYKRDTVGIEFLQHRGVEVIQLDDVPSNFKRFTDALLSELVHDYESMRNFFKNE